jgi:hypothetical protein
MHFSLEWIHDSGLVRRLMYGFSTNFRAQSKNDEAGTVSSGNLTNTTHLQPNLLVQTRSIRFSYLYWNPRVQIPKTLNSNVLLYREEFGQGRFICDQKNFLGNSAIPTCFIF